MKLRSLTGGGCRTFREQGGAHLTGLADPETVERLLEAALRRAEVHPRSATPMT